MKRKSMYFYPILFFGFILAVYAMGHGGDLYFPHVDAQAPEAMHEIASKSGVLFSTLCSLLVVILVTRVVGAAAVALKQPRVVGEIVGGIMLGPSLLGAIAPATAAVILPSVAIPYLSILAQLGVLLFMFLIGLELDIGSLRRSGEAALWISHASIVVPFLMGMGFAFSIYSRMAPAHVAFSSFGLFVGTAMSVTAFPVLAAILSDAGITKTPIGALSLTCAAVDDATAWCLLALVVGLLQSEVGGAIQTIALTAVFIVFMLFVVRPLLVKVIPLLERSSEQISEASLALILVGLLVSAVSTELIGIHALFGGFLLGVIIPHHSLVAKDLARRLEDLVRVFFLPAFFAFTGLRTQIGLLQGASDWWICVALIAVATFGKFFGAFVAAKFSGMETRAAAIIGVLMNTRGLVGLIVLNAGLDLGVLTPRLFTMMVIMAVVTTVMAGPFLRWWDVAADHENSANNILLFRERT